MVPVIDPEAYVSPDAWVIGAVDLAAGASVWPTAVLRGDHGVIKIGERTSIQDGTIVHTTHNWPTVIGADCVVGHRAHLEGCVVEDGCLIGSGSLVLNPASVRNGAVVAAAPHAAKRAPGGGSADERGGPRRDRNQYTGPAAPSEASPPPSQSTPPTQAISPPLPPATTVAWTYPTACPPGSRRMIQLRHSW